MTDGGEHDLGIAGLGPGTRIGQGGTAVVYRARQEELDRDVAVKVLSGAVDDDTRRRFVRERRLMGRLSQHEGMVTVYETGFNARNEPYIVMPLLGRSLADEIAEQPVGWERAAEIISDVCRTVGFAHAQDIVHRDLKPGNIMMSSSGRPLVADFGIARVIDSRTNLEATTLALTPAYSPPEALETTVAEPTSDVYSLGATLYALIAGHAPYCGPGEESTLMTLMRAIVDEPVPQLGDAAPVEIQSVLDRAMAKAPADRFQSVDELADALDTARETAQARFAAASADTVVVDRVDTADSPRGRGGLVAAVVVAVIVALVAGFLIVRSGSGDTDDAAPQTSAATSTEPETVATDGEADDAAGTESDDATAETTATSTPVLVVEGGEVFLLPASEPGDGVFTASIATEPNEALMRFVETGGTGAGATAPAESTPPGEATAVTGVSGTDDGVFGGTEGVAPCSPDELVAGLDPAAPETTAWAEIQEIDVAEIPTFVDGLTASVLTADTRVTDHAFDGDQAIPRQAVLQVGTAVLTDAFGEPKVRCSSGSPLAAPEPVEGDTAYVGAAWETFDPGATVAVVAAPEPVDEFVLTDVGGGPDFIRPVGSSGAADRPLLPGEVRAVGTFTVLPGSDPSAYTTNEISIIFRPEGGDLEGAFALLISIQGVTIDTVGELTGTYDPASGTMTGTGFGATTAGPVSGSGEGAWTATVDPAAGTIVGGADGAVFELTFTPYST